jgi:hypothetical protein
MKVYEALINRIALAAVGIASLPLAANRFDFGMAKEIWNLARLGHRPRRRVSFIVATAARSIRRGTRDVA